MPGPASQGQPRSTHVGRTSRRVALVRRFLVSAAMAASCALGLGAQAPQPATVDTSTIGPQVGVAVPAFSGMDQFGKAHTLESSLGAKGAMLVFFRSADW